jgi:uncharacterized membrane protein YdbT with pleckstrin-like domain
VAETSPGETIRYEAHPPMFRNHPIGFVFSVLLIPVAVGIVILMVWYLSSLARKLTITDRELRYEEGLLSKSRMELRLDSVRSVHVRQSLFQRMFGTGDIEVFSAGDSPEITVKGMPDPQRIRELTG